MQSCSETDHACHHRSRSCDYGIHCSYKSIGCLHINSQLQSLPVCHAAFSVSRLLLMTCNQSERAGSGTLSETPVVTADVFRADIIIHGYNKIMKL